jgi:hypothetical protein
LKSSGIIGVSSHFTVDLDESLLENGGDFTLIQSVLETVPEEKDQRKGFTALVRSRGSYQ